MLLFPVLALLMAKRLQILPLQLTPPTHLLTCSRQVFS